MIRRFFRGSLLFLLLMAVTIGYFTVGTMFFGFCGWLILMVLSSLWPQRYIQRIDIFSISLGIVGAICFFTIDQNARYVVGDSLRKTIDFVNRIAPKKEKEAKNGKE